MSVATNSTHKPDLGQSKSHGFYGFPALRENILKILAFALLDAPIVSIHIRIPIKPIGQQQIHTLN